MCIIVAKLKGSDFPSTRIISTCMERNPDGFSMAWNEDGHIHNFKSMDRARTLEKYIELRDRLNPAETSMIFHARIGTHGSKTTKNCHCWIKNGIAFAHNGILSNIPVKDDMTDSETFFRDYFLPVLKAGKWALAEKVSLAIMGTSKFAFLDGTGNLQLMGHYEKYKEENAKGYCYYSNSSYMSYRFPSFTSIRRETKPARKSVLDRDLDIFKHEFDPNDADKTAEGWDFEI